MNKKIRVALIKIHLKKKFEFEVDGTQFLLMQCLMETKTEINCLHFPPLTKCVYCLGDRFLNDDFLLVYSFFYLELNI